MCDQNDLNLPKARTRFAPSPTGYMHVGNLRTALYEYLIAKSLKGSFILRIEDTDQERYVEDALDIIYKTLKMAGLNHDEGPDIGGNFGPYIQSERMKLDIYKKYALQLVQEQKAYFCFCTKERLDSLKSSNPKNSMGYDRHCRDLDEKEIQTNIASKLHYVIRQKMPLEGTTTFSDLVFGDITVSNQELEDQVLIKGDGFPTYNFANIIDDHLMEITHVVRGSEYLSSVPKYNLLYQALNFPIPQYIHLPLIQGRSEDGLVSKLSKRHGATSFQDLISQGYLTDAIMNYIALLGWCPKDETREIFSLTELETIFSVEGISKSPAIFDFQKLDWFNSEYIKKLSLDEFIQHSQIYFQKLLPNQPESYPLMAEILQSRISHFSEIESKLDFLKALPDFDLNLFTHKKSKTDISTAKEALLLSVSTLENAPIWNKDSLMEALSTTASVNNLKNSQIMWPLRIAITGTSVTPGGAIEMLLLLGKTESLGRIQATLHRL